MQNDGEQRLPMMLPSGDLVEIPFQQTSVTKPLAALTKMCEAGQAVLFLPEEFGSSIVIKMHSGEYETEETRQEDGNCMLDVWIPPAEEVEKAKQKAGNPEAGFVGQR